MSITAYGILRHSGVAIGKQDYLNQAGLFCPAADRNSSRACPTNNGEAHRSRMIHHRPRMKEVEDEDEFEDEDD